jgi:hypothetical protein
MSISGSVFHVCSILDAVLSNLVLSVFISDRVRSIWSSMLLYSASLIAVLFFLEARSILLCRLWILRSVAWCSLRMLGNLFVSVGIVVIE